LVILLGVSIGALITFLIRAGDIVREVVNVDRWDERGPPLNKGWSINKNVIGIICMEAVVVFL